MQTEQLQNTRTHYIHKQVIELEDSTSRKTDVEIEPTVKLNRS